MIDYRGISECIGKLIADIKNSHLQKLFINLSELNYKIKHIHRPNNKTADTLSRASLPDTEFVDKEDLEEVSKIFRITTNIESIDDNDILEDLDMVDILKTYLNILNILN